MIQLEMEKFGNSNDSAHGSGHGKRYEELEFVRFWRVFAMEMQRLIVRNLPDPQPPDPTIMKVLPF